MKNAILGLLATILLSFWVITAIAAPVNINTADAETLASILNGIGPSKAAAIVAYRNKHGKFSNIAEIQNVPGIDRKSVV